MNDTPNIFTSNSRYLPHPIRTVNQSDYTYRNSDCQRAATFLNQDWTPTPTSGTSSNFSTEVPPSPSSSELPPSRSGYPHSGDDSEEDCNAPSDADSRIKREPFSPELPFNYQHRPPHVLPTRRASLSMNDLQSFAGRGDFGSTDSYPVSRSLGNGSPSLNRRVRSSPYHQQTRSWPVALHPSIAPHIHPQSSGSGHHRNLSNNSHSTGSPPHTPTTPSSPALSTKNDSAQSSSTASPPAVVNTDEYIQRISGGKSKCVWNDASGNECGFQSSSSLVKRHVRTVHLKIRYVALCLRCGELYLPAHSPSPVVCPECGQSFATKFHLKTHQNIQYVRFLLFRGGLHTYNETRQHRPKALLLP
jgi:hypothetical protein